MTVQDFQDKLDAIVRDLQTVGKGQTVNILFRDFGNTPKVMSLASDAGGVVNAAQLADIQAVIADLGAYAATFELANAPVQAALEAFKTASEPHQALSDAASLARKTYNDAIAADPDYQAAKTALDAARADVDYQNALNDYRVNNVSENYSELSSAKGKYIV